MNWVVVQIKYSFDAIGGLRTNLIVDAKMLTNSKGKTLFFNSFEDAQDYVVPISKECYAYKFVEVG